MKKTILIVLLVLFASVGVFAQSAKGMSHNGATGLISIPTARIGWDTSAEIGIDAGYHLIFADRPDTTHIPKVGVSLFKVVEFAFAYDTQGGSKDADMLFNGKFELPIEGATHLALGANMQGLKAKYWGDNREWATQIYVAATYPGTFFKMPAETTVVFGKTFGDDAGAPKKAIDFGMGFDLLLFPDKFKNYIHWISDFSNFSYSLHAIGANAWHRGTFNTGLRFDLSEVAALSKFKFVIDAQVTDLLDEDRTFVIGATFGIGLK